MSFKLTSTKVCLVIGLTTLLTPAFAWKNGFNPAATPAKRPDNGAETQVWKLAGTPTGAQIAPSWVLAAAHLAPGVGQTFKNGYGSATVKQCMTPPYIKQFLGQWTPDLQLCQLNQPIPLTGGAKFPTLVENPWGLIKSSADLPRTSINMGHFLATGFGAPGPGQAAAWMDFGNLPPSFEPWTSNAVQPVPYPGSGDSGSPIYWFMPDKSEPAMVGVTVVGTQIAAQQFFSLKELDWIASTVLNNSSEQVTTIALANFTSPITALPPTLLPVQVGAVGGVKINGSSVSNATIQWSRPISTDGTSVKRYLVLTGANGKNVTSSFVTDTGATDYTNIVSGLAPSTDYTTCVIPFNAIGMGPVDQVKQGLVNDPSTLTLPLSSSSRNCASIYTGPAPDRIQNVTISPYTTARGVKTFKVTWTAPTTPTGVRIADYRMNINEDNSMLFRGFVGNVTSWVGTPLDPAIASSRICVQLTPYGASWIQGEIGVPVCSVIPH